MHLSEHPEAKDHDQLTAPQTTPAKPLVIPRGKIMEIVNIDFDTGEVRIEEPPKES